ncbi:MAG: VWA domain-containing protein [Acidobacteria bacterium]|nr:VWA domain-containing protein [Acidobacteriota bacterium]
MRILVALFAPVLMFAAGPPQQPPPQTVFRAGAGEVLADVVVRDKKGKLVRNLEAGDIHVFENGVEQKVTSFRQVRSPGAMREDKEVTVQQGRGDALAVQRQIRLVSLVFKGMGSEGRYNARQAALDFLDADYGPNAYYAVFYINRVFRPVLAYTNDRERIKTAIQQVTGWVKAPVAGPRDIGAPPPVGGGGSRGPDFAGAMAAMEDFNARMDLNMFGAIDIFSLWGVIAELGRLPGRKSVLYFSEGIALPIDYRAQYLSMISAANLANVTVYSIDARGLFAASDMMRPRANLAAATVATQDVTTHAADTPGSGGFGSTELAMDRALQSIYDNPQQNLFDLAEKTGGFLIANRNDFRKPMQQLADDFNTYYEVTYRPSDTNYDGRFRAIEVKVNQPNVKVQARDGYFALPPMEGQAVFPFEVPLLHALDRRELARDLSFRSRVLLYRGGAGERRGVLVFDMPLGQTAFAKEEKGVKARNYTSFLALIKDANGRVAAKLSRDLPVEVPVDRVAAFREGRSIVTRPVALAPGRYTLETAVSDNLAGKVAARRSVLIVPADRSGPSISDVALVRRVDPAGDVTEREDPLSLAAGRVIPTLEEKFRAGKGGQLAVFAMLYPDPSGPPPALFVDLLADGKVARREQPAMPKPGEGGVPLIARIPTESLPAGVYELRVAMVQGAQGDKRSIAIEIE